MRSAHLSRSPARRRRTAAESIFIIDQPDAERMDLLVMPMTVPRSWSSRMLPGRSGATVEATAFAVAAVAIAFEDHDGIQRRGVLGLCGHHGDTWRPSGAFMGSVRVAGDRDVWMTWGGWGPGDSRERAVTGGWVADPGAASTRLVDPSRRILSEEVENGVVLFMWKGDFDLHLARLELLDTGGRVTRSGPVRRER